MLVSTRQMSRAHALLNYYPAVSCNRKLLERVTTAKIQGVHMDEHLTWADQVAALLSSCYAALAVLRKLCNLAPYYVHKQLVESLVISATVNMLCVVIESTCGNVINVEAANSCGASNRKSGTSSPTWASVKVASWRRSLGRGSVWPNSVGRSKSSIASWIGSVERAPVCWEGGRGFRHRRH